MEKNEELISIILPVYNVEKYLRRCLDSIINQTYKNIEIIIVNDGSTDNSLDICNEYYEKDSRIKIITKKNEGLGMARNTGINNASGEYVCFFDSDDFIERDAIEKMYNVIEKEHPQLVCYGFKKLDGNGNIIHTCIPDTNKNVFLEDEVINEFLPELISENPDTGKCWNLTMSAWACIYSMKLIKDTGWRFVSEREIISEDVYSLLILYKNVKKVAVLKEALYYYCVNPKSLTNTYRKDRYEKIEYFYQKCKEACKELNYPRFMERRIIYPFLGNTIAALKQIVNSKNQFKNKFKDVKAIIEDNTLQEVVESSKHNKWDVSKKILFFLIRHKMSLWIYFLFILKNRT